MVTWTPEMIGALKELRALNVPLYRCAERIGVAYPTAVYKARDLGLAGRRNRGRKSGERVRSEPAHALDCACFHCGQIKSLCGAKRRKQMAEVKEELSEAGLLDLKAQFDDVNPNDSAVIDVGVIQSLIRLALKGDMRDRINAAEMILLHK
jgi:hypothetical protein